MSGSLKSWCLRNEKNFLERFGDYIKKREQIRKNLYAYERKRSDFEKRLDAEFIDHGIATIPCNVSGMDDIISSYSVPGYESLNSDFVDYLGGVADLVPEQYPIVLSIVGTRFTEAEQNIIRRTIEYDTSYNLGSAEKESRHLLKMFIIMAIGTVLTGLMISMFEWGSPVSLEFIYIFFWFFAYTIVEYTFIDGRELKKQRIRAARLACTKVIFSEEFDESDYSEEEAKEILDELQNETAGDV